jgi:hypothetical protein
MQDRRAEIDWAEVARRALGSAVLAGLVSGALDVLVRIVEREINEPSSPHVDPETSAAVELLGVSVDATEAEIRAALRAKLIATRAHPDHGGDAELTRRLIDARDLLLKHAQSRRES